MNSESGTPRRAHANAWPCQLRSASEAQQGLPGDSLPHYHTPSNRCTLNHKQRRTAGKKTHDDAAVFVGSKLRALWSAWNPRWRQHRPRRSQVGRRECGRAAYRLWHSMDRNLNRGTAQAEHQTIKPCAQGTLAYRTLLKAHKPHSLHWKME